MKLNVNQFDGGGDTLPANPPKPLAPSPLAAQESGAIGATSMASQSGAYKEPGKGAGMKMGPAKAKAPVDKSGYDRSIKVPQATVDAVKNDGRGNMGQAAANKVAYGSPGYNGSTFSPNAPVSKEYKEATKRVYPNAKATSPAASSGATNPNQPGPKAAAPKASAPKASAFPPILPAPSKPKATPKPNSAAALPPLMTPPTPKASAPAKVKVSQSMVDSVKKDGKAKAIANAKTNVTNAEYKEAVKRIYQSPAKPKPKAKSGGGGGRTSSAVL